MIKETDTFFYSKKNIEKVVFAHVTAIQNWLAGEQWILRDCGDPMNIIC